MTTADPDTVAAMTPDTTVNTVTAQYEAFPYPARNPADEAKRLIEGSPSHLDEVIHFAFGGRWTAAPFDGSRPLRVLVAGGGTGDALVMLAQHCADRGLAADITYLDLSQTARRLAEARIAARGLDGVRFVTGSLLDVGRLAPGPFDYIDCCGVLHHLDDPFAGLTALAEQLDPAGAIGLMVYGRHGRDGVYALQSALRRLTADDPATAKVEAAKRLLERLPPTNGFRRNPFVNDHRKGDAGLYDLLLHSRDRPFTVEDLDALIRNSGLGLAALVPPLLYDPDRHLTDGALRRRAATLSPIARAALAEELLGSLVSHVAYAVHPDRVATATATITSTAVPVLRGLDGRKAAQALPPGKALQADFRGQKLSFALPDLAPAILARIDGVRSLDALYGDLAATRTTLRREQFDDAFAALFAVIGGLNQMYLRVPR